MFIIVVRGRVLGKRGDDASSASSIGCENFQRNKATRERYLCIPQRPRDEGQVERSNVYGPSKEGRVVKLLVKHAGTPIYHGLLAIYISLS